jgi:hypothetical protein
MTGAGARLKGRPHLHPLGWILFTNQSGLTVIGGEVLNEALHETGAIDFRRLRQCAAYYEGRMLQCPEGRGSALVARRGAGSASGCCHFLDRGCNKFNENGSEPAAIFRIRVRAMEGFFVRFIRRVIRAISPSPGSSRSSPIRLTAVSVMVAPNCPTNKADCPAD